MSYYSRKKTIKALKAAAFPALALGMFALSGIVYHDYIIEAATPYLLVMFFMIVLLSVLYYFRGPD